MTDTAIPIQPRSDLIACPVCDATFALAEPSKGQQAKCARCGTVLISPRHKAGKRIMALCMSIFVLICAASVLPFLSVQTGGISNAVSVLDVALAFSHGPLVPLTFTTACLIFFIPVLRVVLSIYVLAPLVADRPPARHAAGAFRMVEALRPWSMAEIFAIGCAVALIKISALVEVSFGPAFWMFAILVVLVVVQENVICRWSVWNALSPTQKS